MPEFARGTGEATYAHNTIILFGGVFAKYVRLTINTTWGGIPQSGLSEVRFFSIPVQAREPVPADAATGVDLDAMLSWRPGREAASHRVYFGKDRDAVAKGTAPATTVADFSLTPAALAFGTTYYWHVDEVNNARTPAVYEGSVWSFATQEYGVVDDFESYTDDEGSRIYEAWVDGYGTTTNGSQVGYAESAFRGAGTGPRGSAVDAAIVQQHRRFLPVGGRTDLRHGAGLDPSGHSHPGCATFGAIPITPRASCISRSTA